MKPRTAGRITNFLEMNPMNPEIVVASNASPDLKAAVERVRQLVLASAAEASRRGYASDFAHFTRWAQDRNLTPLPATPEVCCLYIAAISDELALSTILRRLTSIGYAHRMAGFTENPASTNNPLLATLMKGLRRVKGVAHQQKEPLLTSDIRQIVSGGRGLLGIRNAALLLVGYAGGLRREELISLNCSDVGWHSEGITVRIKKSKTDGAAKGRTIGIPFGADETTCPVRCLELWLKAAGISGDEPIFRGVNRHGKISRHRLSSGSVARIIQAAARAGGMAARAKNLAGHSLRSGHVSQAALAGPSLDEATVMRQTGHTSPEMLRRYRRIHDLFVVNSAAHLGL
jgi:integrase